MENFDVFLCHNSEDKPVVREISRKLVEKNIKPWLDEDEIRPGTSWQIALGRQIEIIRSAAVFVGASGVGPWQNQEIQALLSQFVKRECPVIPVVLPSAKTTPDLPWTLENLHCVDFRVTYPDPLQQLIWGITGEKPEALSNLPTLDRPATMRDAAKCPLFPSRDDHAPKLSKTRLYPPLAEPPDKKQAAQLEILRGRVMEYWVEGVLRHSLHNEVLISLGKRPIDKAVDAPWKYSVEVSDTSCLTLLEDRDVSAIYDTTGLLLILGEPGSGKTTTLLDLARTLLRRAGDDIRERVPVVLNLSSWKKRQQLAEWIAGELSEKYRVPVKLARSWVQNDYLVPLLDGLDEVPTALQPDCVAAINDFIDGSEPSGIVVCCRLMEYQWLPHRLKLNGAICLESLSSEEVGKYLARGGSKLAALRDAVNRDPVLQELAQTPLMLSIMSLACQGAGGDELARQKGDLAEERRQVFRLYVEQMFQRKGMTSLVFPKEKIIGWLSWLARRMREHSQSVFLVEGLQPSWLGTSWLGARVQRAAYGIVMALGLALIGGLICGLIGLIFGLIGLIGLNEGLMIGLIGGLIFGLSILLGIGLGCWSELPGFMSGLIGGLTGLIGGLTGLIGGLIGLEGLGIGLNEGLGIGLIFGLGPIVGLIGGLGVGSLSRITLVESWKWTQFWKKTIPGSMVGLGIGLFEGQSRGLSEALSEGLIGALIGGLISGLVGGFTDTVKVGKAFPNQGIKLSRKNSLAAFLVTWLIFGLIGGSIVGLIGGSIVGLIVGLIGGSIVGLISGLNRGGSAVIKHYALRLTLCLSGYTPFKFVDFLDHCARLILLKKVGGGYIFIHRMLLEYFAELTTVSTKVEHGVEAKASRNTV